MWHFYFCSKTPRMSKRNLMRKEFISAYNSTSSSLIKGSQRRMSVREGTGRQKLKQKSWRNSFSSILNSSSCSSPFLRTAIPTLDFPTIGQSSRKCTVDLPTIKGGILSIKISLSQIHQGLCQIGKKKTIRTPI